MLKTAKWIRCSLVSLAAIALTLATMPVLGVRALVPTPSPEPAAPAAFRQQRLERAWLREQIAHDRLGVMFEHVDQRLALAQQLIDRASANGKDVSAVQTALDNLSKAITQARPTFEGMQGIMGSHQGFDAAGQVTDVAQAASTVAQVREELVQIRGMLAGPGQALRAAVQAFRAANQAP
jgi:hypothetical protein